MTELLCRLFVKDRDNIRDPGVRRSYGIMTSLVGIVLNILLAAGKLTVGLLFSSISVTADAVNNLSDAGSQVISQVTFRIAAKPADHDHPFGHARIEYVTSMIVSFAVLLVGWELLSGSVKKILHPAGTTFSWLTAAVLAVSALVKLWLCLFNRKVDQRVGSPVMRATAADSLSDAAATAAVLAAQLFFRFTGLDIDAYVGVAVALLIVWAGVRILIDTKNSILGERPSDEVVERIKETVAGFPGALGIHDLVVHDYGPGRLMASLHVEVDGSEDMFAAHDMIDCIERRLQLEYGIAATVHMDPIAVNDPLLEALKKQAETVVHGIDERIRIHDFRMVPGDTHTNLIFDMAVPFDVSVSDAELRHAAAAGMAAVRSDLFTVITIDRE